MSHPKIICMGEPMIEFNQVDDTGRYLFGYGGDTSNCAIAAARAGASVGFFTALGADEFGDSLMQLWADNGVDASQVLRNPDAIRVSTSSAMARTAMSSPICARVRRRAA
ncbi:2-keto-3-deoxygluconate kinase [Nitratireductor aquibiodomus RA22]|uniref:2-keto-3-deoxygluconate kinase n=1 Tax=Nitratireductor aquibiodomus RA22 TaxID=1189611 RepID=I5BW46_9HYPH|nr:2-keto-3-deoxygluconate kinase [Nitratireductor aquibiodomus RA22]